LLWAAFSPPEWRVGDIVLTNHRFHLPDSLSPGPYGLEVGLYSDPSIPIPVIGADGRPGSDSFQLWRQKVPLPPQPIPPDVTKTDVRLGEQIILEGYTVRVADRNVSFDQIKPGDAFTMTLYWRALSAVSNSYHIFVHVQSPAGELLTGSDGPPQDGAYPTNIWDAGEVVATVHTLTLPPGSDGFSIRLGMYPWPDLTRLPVIQDGKQAPDGAALLWPVSH
jgi:hypothetical protein